MTHPKERPTADRREFLRRAAMAGIAVPSLSAILAACRDSSTGGSGTTGAGGIPLATPDTPVKLPLYDDIPAVADGLEPEAGPLKVYNWNDYIYKKVIKQFQDEYGVEVEFTQFLGMSEAMNKVQNGTVQFDLFFPTIENVSKLVGAKLLQPWNRSYITNLGNIWTYLSDPWYDKGGRYTLPYLTWKTGIGYRRDFVDDPSTYDMPYDVFWDPKYAGKVGVLDEYRETMGMSLQRTGYDFNSTNPDELAAATDELIAMIDATDVDPVGPADYQYLANGESHVRYSWSGNMNYAQWYLPKDTSVGRARLLLPAGGRLGGGQRHDRDSKDAENPVLAHHFIDFLLRQDVALTNFGYEGFQPPLVGVDRATFLEAGYIPPNLENTLVSEEDFQQGVPVLPLSPQDDTLYQDEWARFKAGAS